MWRRGGSGSEGGGGGAAVIVGQIWYLLYNEQVTRMRVTRVYDGMVVLMDVEPTNGCVRVLSTSIAGLKSAALDDRDVTTPDASVLSPNWDDTTVSERPRGIDDNVDAD